jgi:hypothetical protein
MILQRLLHPLGCRWVIIHDRFPEIVVMKCIVCPRKKTYIPNNGGFDKYEGDLREDTANETVSKTR